MTSLWRWIPTLYFGQGLPYVVVMTLSVVMYKNLGLDNTAIALYTSWLYLPWVIKPLWSPLVDLLGTRRAWVVRLQFVVGAALAGVALTLPMPGFLQMSLAVFWLMAFASATHDIAADGFYMMALPQHQQAAFVGIRSLFYRVSMIAGQGGLVYLAGHLAETTGQVVLAWQVVLGLLAVTFLLLVAWHRVRPCGPLSWKPSPASFAAATSPWCWPSCCCFAWARRSWSSCWRRFCSTPGRRVGWASARRSWASPTAPSAWPRSRWAGCWAAWPLHAGASRRACGPWWPPSTRPTCCTWCWRCGNPTAWCG
jgi:hypothetical protein